MPTGDVKSQGIGFASGTSIPDTAAATQLPIISTSGVLTPAQIQQQINKAWATAAAKLATDQLELTEDLTGRGFSANSPMLLMLNSALSGQCLSGQLLAESEIVYNTAKLNSEAIFASQTEVSKQFQQQEQILVDVQRNQVTQVVGIVQAVCGMVGAAI